MCASLIIRTSCSSERSHQRMAVHRHSHSHTLLLKYLTNNFDTDQSHQNCTLQRGIPWWLCLFIKQSSQYPILFIATFSQTEPLPIPPKGPYLLRLTSLAYCHDNKTLLVEEVRCSVFCGDGFRSYEHLFGWKEDVCVESVQLCQNYSRNQ